MNDLRKTILGITLLLLLAGAHPLYAGWGNVITVKTVCTTSGCFTGTSCPQSHPILISGGNSSVQNNDNTLNVFQIHNYKVFANEWRTTANDMKAEAVILCTCETGTPSCP
ncbi:MAG: hypothetical protein Q7S13_03965 [Candidatus Omnitrophota bacterium]|nr:hypothetical protein [Candidatus Omnitrophota bacterium]